MTRHTPKTWPVSFLVDTSIEPLAPGDFSTDSPLRFIEFQKVRTDAGLVTRILYARWDGLINYAWPKESELAPITVSLGTGLGLSAPAEFLEDQFELDEHGIRVAIDFTDARGNRFVYKMDARTRSRWEGFRFAAPPGAGMHRPTSLFVPYLFEFDFVNVPQEYAAHFNGEALKHKKAPIIRRGRRTISLKAARQANIIEFQADQGQLLTESDSGLFITEAGHLQCVEKGVQGRRVRLEFANPMPPISEEALSTEWKSNWQVSVEGDPILSGTWTQWPRVQTGQVEHPNEAAAEVAISLTSGWGGVRDDRWMALLTRFVGFLRKWPLAYHWRGVIKIPDCREPEIQGRWINTQAAKYDG